MGEKTRPVPLRRLTRRVGVDEKLAEVLIDVLFPTPSTRLNLVRPRERCDVHRAHE